MTKPRRLGGADPGDTESEPPPTHPLGRRLGILEVLLQPLRPVGCVDGTAGCWDGVNAAAVGNAAELKKGAMLLNAVVVV